MTAEPQQNARDRFIEVLRSRGMLKPGEEWVVDANLNAVAHELAERQRDWARKTYDSDVYVDEMTYARLKEQADLIDPESS